MKIYQSKSHKWPGGRADSIVTGLNEAKQPKDKISEANLLIQITNMSNKKNEEQRSGETYGQNIGHSKQVY